MAWVIEEREHMPWIIKEREYMPWIIEELEFTTWCELELPDALIWLEWNERVFAYRCGISRNGLAGRSHLGFADSLKAAQAIALRLLELN